MCDKKETIIGLKTDFYKYLRYLSLEICCKY